MHKKKTTNNLHCTSAVQKTASFFKYFFFCHAWSLPLDYPFTLHPFTTGVLSPIHHWRTITAPCPLCLKTAPLPPPSCASSTFHVITAPHVQPLNCSLTSKLHPKVAASTMRLHHVSVPPTSITIPNVNASKIPPNIRLDLLHAALHLHVSSIISTQAMNPHQRRQRHKESRHRHNLYARHLKPPWKGPLRTSSTLASKLHLQLPCTFEPIPPNPLSWSSKPQPASTTSSKPSHHASSCISIKFIPTASIPNPS